MKFLDTNQTNRPTVLLTTLIVLRVEDKHKITIRPEKAMGKLKTKNTGISNQNHSKNPLTEKEAKVIRCYPIDVFQGYNTYDKIALKIVMIL